jgi:hypothetical protein
MATYNDGIEFYENHKGKDSGRLAKCGKFAKTNAS